MFNLILADPPWKFKTYSPKGMGRSPKYPLMTIEELKKLNVTSLAAKNCILFGWVTDPFLKIGIEVFESWGFSYKTVGFYWVKTKNGKYTQTKGYYTRGNPEQCLIFTKGSPPKRLDKGVSKLLVSDVGPHSRKPDEVYDRIDLLYGPDFGPRVELFATKKRAGYTSLGYDIDGRDLKEVLCTTTAEA